MILDSLKICKYIETPECPRCGSNRTGIYVYSPNNFSAISIIKEKQMLKRGQLIRYTSIPLSEFGQTIFCDDCEAGWLGKYKTLRLSKYELELKVSEKYIDTEKVDEIYKVDKKLKKQNRPAKRFSAKYLTPFIPFASDIERAQKRRTANNERDEELNPDID